MTSQSPSLLPDPRLKNKIAHYDRDEVVADILSFYNFLPHVSAANIAIAPPEGWPEITASSLEVHGIHKTPEAIELMRHLPYISYDQPWILITAMVCDYRRVTVSRAAYREHPYWLALDVAEEQWPAWVVQLTSGLDREGHRYMLDTTDGTITMSCIGGHFQYPPTYEPDDPRGWRDRECYPETVTLKDWLETCRAEYRQMDVVAVPNNLDPLYGAPELLFHVKPLDPASSDFREIEGLRKIYREYGWPDTEQYQKEACIQAIIPWWTNMMDVRHKESKLEKENLWKDFWKKRGLPLPKEFEQESSTEDAGKESCE